MLINDIKKSHEINHFTTFKFSITTMFMIIIIIQFKLIRQKYIVFLFTETFSREYIRNIEYTLAIFCTSH